MVYRIAVCDDNPADTDYVRDLAACWASNSSLDVNIQCFSSAEQFLFQNADNKDWDILLLDIEMGDVDGVSLAKKIRRENASVQIVFLTGFPDFMADGYEVSALHYLLKPVPKEKLFAVLDRAVKLLDRNEPVLLVPWDGEILRLSVSEIQYVEAFAHSVNIVTEEKSYSVRIPISELEQRLPSSVIRCHRSYLVNLKHIAKLSKTQVTLDSNISLPLSRSAAPFVHKSFVQYYSGEHNEFV